MFYQLVRRFAHIVVISATLALSSDSFFSTASGVPPNDDAKQEITVEQVSINKQDGAEMVWVPAGKFIMGSSNEELTVFQKKDPNYGALLHADEGPQHVVYLDGYFIYK